MIEEFDHKIDIAVIGFQKCGTHSMRAWLQARPDLYVHDQEFCPFAQPDHWNFGNKELRTFFDRKPKDDKRRNVTVATQFTLLDYPSAAAGLANNNPECKIVAMVRDRADRAFSAWNMARTMGGETRSFRRAIEEIASTGTFSLNADEWSQDSYLDAGMYKTILQTYEWHFPAKNILVVPLDSLQDESVVIALGNFLETVVSEESAKNFPHEFGAVSYGGNEITESDRKFIEDYYRSRGEIE